jgi:hypothetical protein
MISVCYASHLPDNNELLSEQENPVPQKKNYRDLFLTSTRPIRAIIAANTGNPREFACVVTAEVAGVVVAPDTASVSPVEYSRTLPASIVMVVEKSWYPAFVIFSACVPGDNPEIIVGLIPFTSLSTETTAPAGVVVTDSEPVVSELVDCPWTCGVVTGAFVGILSLWVAGVSLTTGWEVVVDKGTRSAEITTASPG